MGAPKGNQNARKHNILSKVVAVKITAEEHKQWKETAGHIGMTLSAFMRQRIRLSFQLRKPD